MTNPYKMESYRNDGDVLGSHRLLEVSASASMTVLPDQVSVLLSVISRKDNINDVKNSVQRRLDYIRQTLHNHEVKENDISFSKVMSRDGSLYALQAEFAVIFSDFAKCQQLNNFLLEKLDDTFTITAPIFTHSNQCLQDARIKTCKLAVQNARIKATEIAKLVKQSLGKVRNVNEEFCNEVEKENHYPADAALSWRMKADLASVIIKSKVNIAFEMIGKSDD